MGSEILLLIVIPGAYSFARLCYLALVAPLFERCVYLVALLGGLGLGVRGMVSAYIPSIPENWNASFLVGWFLMSASFWLIAAHMTARLTLLLKQRLQSRKV